MLDEPTSALDVAVQAQILNRMVGLQKEFDLSYLLITHNVAAVRYVADRVAVMYLGKIAEIGPVDDVLEHPLHPYSKALLAAVPVPDVRRRRSRFKVTGEIPTLTRPSAGLPLCDPMPVRHRPVPGRRTAPPDPARPSRPRGRLSPGRGGG